MGVSFAMGREPLLQKTLTEKNLASYYFETAKRSVAPSRIIPTELASRDPLDSGGALKAARKTKMQIELR
jgi:hypothetical protein